MWILFWISYRAAQENRTLRVINGYILSDNKDQLKVLKNIWWNLASYFWVSNFPKVVKSKLQRIPGFSNFSSMQMLLSKKKLKYKRLLPMEILAECICTFAASYFKSHKYHWDQQRQWRPSVSYSQAVWGKLTLTDKLSMQESPFLNTFIPQKECMRIWRRRIMLDFPLVLLMVSSVWTKYLPSPLLKCASG